MSAGTRHLYVHLPFCAHRCGYCDFVTLVGRRDGHGAYVDALLAELELERSSLADEVETVFLGGGTPTFTEPAELARLLAGLPSAAEITVEANPETVTPELASAAAGRAKSRASRSARRASGQNCSPCSSARRARSPSGARSTICVMPDLTTSRSTSSTGSPARAPPTSPSTSQRRSPSGLSTSPATSSKPSQEPASPTRTAASSSGRRRRWRATSSWWSRPWSMRATAGTRRRTSVVRAGRLATTSVTGSATTTSASGSAPSRRSTVCAGGTARAWARTSARSPRGGRPPREEELLEPETVRRERLLLGLRLDEPLALARVGGAVDEVALARMEQLGLATVRDGSLALTRRGRFLGGGVTAELLTESPAKSTI